MADYNLFNQPPPAPKPAPPKRVVCIWEPGMRVQFSHHGVIKRGVVTEKCLGGWPGVKTDDGKKWWVPAEKLRTEAQS
jgi:hypothetical protein